MERMGGRLSSNPPTFLKDRNVFSDKKVHFPLSEAAKSTQELLAHEEEATHNDLVIEPSGLQDIWSCKVQWGQAAPASVFLKTNFPLIRSQY